VVGHGVPFHLFGPAHLAALAVTATAAVALARMVGRRPASRGIRFGLALFLVATVVAWLLHEAARRPLSVWDVLPLHLCDFLILVAVYALLTLRRLACELLYFWSAGTLLAMVTPDLGAGFPDPAFLVYFALHGAVVVAAAVVVRGLGQRPQPGAARPSPTRRGWVSWTTPWARTSCTSAASRTSRRSSTRSAPGRSTS